jgi:hypothetical protein
VAPPSLSAAELLDAAAICRDGRSVETSVYLAALALPGLSLDEAADLAIGARDAALARLYAAMFGSQLALATNCPRCAARLDISLTTDALSIDPAAAARPVVEIGGGRFGVRVLNSVDLAAIAEFADVEAGREQLALRCLVPIEDAAVPETLLDDEVDAVSAALAAIDPGSDFYVPLTCFECAAVWDAPVDLGRVLATEIEAAADTLMDDIHDLALAYHWSEAAIVALPPARRRAYLQRLRR